MSVKWGEAQDMVISDIQLKHHFANHAGNTVASAWSGNGKIYYQTWQTVKQYNSTANMAKFISHQIFDYIKSVHTGNWFDDKVHYLKT